MENRIKKENFSLGINLVDGLQKNKELINKYKDYLSSIYIGPSLDLLNNKYTALEPYTQIIQSVYNTDFNKYENDLLEICNFARQNSIEICLTINNNKTDINELYNISAFLNKLNPEQVCTSKKFLPWFKENYGNAFYIQTFFEGGPHNIDIENHTWDSYVIKHKDILNNLVKNAENRLLINQSCPDICNGCFTKKNVSHQKLIDKEFTTPERYFARHMWGREDIEFFKQVYPNIKYCFKISSRIRSLNNPKNDDLQRIDKYLNILINGSIKDLMNDEIKDLACVYVGLFKNSNTGRKLGFNYNFSNFDFDLFLKEKEDWWNQLT